MVFPGGQTHKATHPGRPMAVAANWNIWPTMPKI